MTLRAAAAALLAAWDAQRSILPHLAALRRALAVPDTDEQAREAELERLREIARRAGRETGPA